MMNYIKTWKAVSLIAVSTLLLTACSGGGSEAADGAVTLNFWYSASGKSAEVVDKAVADFNAAHEGEITVVATYQGSYEDAIVKLANGVQSGNQPDLMQVNDINTRYMFDTGLTVPASTLNSVADTKVDFDNYLSTVKNYYTLDGELRSVPFQISQPALFLNPDLVIKAGLNINQPPTTTSEAFDWAAQIHEATGKGGIVFHLTPWWMEELTASLGISYCTPDNGVGKEPAETFVFTDPGQIEQWTQIQDLYASGAAVNVGMNGDSAQSIFIDGESGMILASSAATENIVTNAAFTPVVIPFPIDGDGGGAVIGGNSVWVLGEDPEGKREQAAWTFAAYLASDEVQAESFRASGYLPATQGAVDIVSHETTSVQQVLLDQLVNSPSKNAAAGCHSGALQTIRNELQSVLEAIAIDGADVADQFANLEAKAPELVDTYNRRVGK